MTHAPMTSADLAQIQALLSRPHMNNAREVIGFVESFIGKPFQSLAKNKAAEKILDYADETRESGGLFLDAVAHWVDSPEELIPVLKRTQKHSLLPCLDGFLVEQLQDGERPNMALNAAIEQDLPKSAAFLRARCLDQDLPSPTRSRGKPRF